MKSGLIAFLFLTSFSSALAGDIVCKVLPQIGEAPDFQLSGTYTLIELKDAQGLATGYFEIQYTKADGTQKRTLSKKAPLRTQSKDSEEALYAYEYYLGAIEGYPNRKNAQIQDVALFSRVYAGSSDDPVVMLMFWQDAAGNILDIFGENPDTDFLCEENEKNPTTLPKAPRVG